MIRRLIFAILVTVVFLASLLASFSWAILLMAILLIAVFSFIYLFGGAPPANPTRRQRVAAWFTAGDDEQRERKAEWISWLLIPFLGTNNRWWLWVGVITIASTILFFSTPFGDTPLTIIARKAAGLEPRPWGPWLTRFIATAILWPTWLVYTGFAFSDEARRSAIVADRWWRERAEGTTIEPILRRILRRMFHLPANPPRTARPRPAPAGTEPRPDHGNFNQIFWANMLAETIGTILGRWLHP